MAQRFSRVLCALPCREPIESYIGRERQMVEGGRRGGRRADGRGARHLRPVRLVPGFLPPAEGSVLIEVGATRVICKATVQEGVHPLWPGQVRVRVMAEYSTLLEMACVGS